MFKGPLGNMFDFFLGMSRVFDSQLLAFVGTVRTFPGGQFVNILVLFKVLCFFGPTKGPYWNCLSFFYIF